MHETQDIPERMPAWAVIEMPEVFPGIEFAGHSLNHLAGKPAGAQWLDAGLQAIHDLEEVRRVNASLFPRNLPQLASLAYAGVCVEAGHAGGDYYDFFDRGPHRLGFAVGDVSGKGIASALLRATVQASLRTLCSIGVDDLGRSLALVNRMLCESAREAMYATLFFAEYDERSRRLRYVNCGHPAPLLHRNDHDAVSRLEPTSTVLGLFNDWQCSIGEVRLGAGDTLLLYTDGVSEAGAPGEEFGQDRLLELLEAQNHLPLSVLLQSCINNVRRFSGGRQVDDLTLVALRGIEFEQ